MAESKEPGAATSSAHGDDDGNLVHREIERLRTKLLDLTTRNPLLSFKHSGRAIRFVRIIDEVPNVLFERLEREDREATFRFRSLGAASDVPRDEDTATFRRALDAAKLEDRDYIDGEKALTDQDGEKALLRLEHALRVRVRERLGLPPLSTSTPSDPGVVAKKKGLDPSFELPVAAAGQSQHTDSFLQTLLFEERMLSTLSKMREHVNHSLDETGVNPLFAVFGFLEWYEDDASQVPYFAPLLVYQLHLHRDLANGKYTYGISSGGNGAQANVALAARLRRDFDLGLPDFDEDMLPEDYFQAVHETVAGKTGWKVRRWVTIGLLSFAKIAMYRDLDPAQWDDSGGLPSHDGLRHILTGASKTAEPAAPSSDHAAEDHSEFDTPLVSDADSSQLRAIQDVMAGRSMVIEGPPGSGKSQTITNVIAAAMAAGKSVLFLAEKMAALNVVKDRLAAANLGEFCLEIHSTKASRKALLAQLSNRLNKPRATASDSELAGTLRDLGVLQSQLGACTAALSGSAGALGATVHDLMWRTHIARRRTEGVPDEIDGFTIRNPLELTDIDIDRIAHAAGQAESLYRTIARQYGSQHHHPWRGVANAALGVMQVQDCVRAISRLAKCATSVAVACDALHGLTGWEVSSCRELGSISGAASFAGAAHLNSASLVSRLSSPLGLSTARVLVQTTNHLQATKTRLQTALLPGVRMPRSATLNRIAEAVQSLRLNGTVEDLPPLMAASRTSKNELEEQFKILSSAASLAKVPHPGSRSAERCLAAAIDCAANAPDAPRTEGLLGRGAVSRLLAAQRAQGRLRDIREKLSARFVLSEIPAVALLRESARAVRSAPFLPMLSSRYRSARHLHRGLSKVRARIPRETIASDLDALADFAIACITFQDDQGLRDTLGGAVPGIDYDLSQPLMVAAWAEKALQLTSSESTMHGLGEFLLRGTEDSVKAFANLAAQPHYFALCRALGADGVPVEQALTDASRRDERVSTLVEDTALSGAQPTTPLHSFVQLAKEAESVEALEAELLSQASAVHETLGDSFLAPEASVSPIAEALRFVDAIDALGLPKAIRSWVLSHDPAKRIMLMADHAATASRVTREFENCVHSLESLTPADYQTWLGVASPADIPARELEAVAVRCANDSDGLAQLCDFLRLRSDLESAGLDELLTFAERLEPAREFGLLARRVAYQSILREAFASSPALAGFSGTQHEQRRTRFRELDRNLLALRRRKIAADLSRRSAAQGNGEGPRSTWTEMALIANEVAKQKKHISARDLLSRAGNAIKTLTPCFMMSPLSIAQYLPALKSQFDLVIMDEASQLRPEDAIGGIARAKQVVIVGDPKQLPPTSFFVGADNSNDGEDDEESAADNESILDAASTVMGTPRRLRWHYRSRHPSLIAFSNKEFYQSELVVFPAPFSAHPSLGVSSCRITDSTYSCGINPMEGRRIAEAAVEYARRHPERSLGIVTLNQKQAELVSLEIDRLAAEQPDFEAWRKDRSETLEPFFVKNLENVQGDERDAILISTVYGKDSAGNFYQRFGPINLAGGHRRLNVLFTRAKFQMIVYTSMDAGEIKTDAKSSLGLLALKNYLSFARSGQLEGPVESGRPTESPFEDAVVEALRSSGVRAEPQVGVAGYRIDLAVSHPERVGEYVLGIECDGATYHSERSARDRDRLRQENLERLGWRIHRIWSVDWYARPRQELQRLEQAIQHAIKQSDTRHMEARNEG